MRGNHVRLDYGNYRDIFYNLERKYHLWGYTLASIPLFDDISYYTELLTEQEYEKTIRFVHSDGRILFLRSDITLFLTRFIASHAIHETLPLRLSYLGEIVRVQDQHDLYEHETLQSGAELIGVGGLEGDAEILLLLQECMETLGKEDRFVHIGSRALLRAIAAVYTCDYVQLCQMLSSRDATLCNQLLADLPKDTRLRLHELLFFIGTYDEFSNWYSKNKTALPAEVQTQCNYLQKLCSMVLDCKHFPHLHIDISEIGSHPYYSGLVFSVYQKNAARALASGGRYDGLLYSLTKKKIAATGFSLYPLQLSHRVHSEDPLRSDTASFTENFHQAQKNREKGLATIL